MQPYGPYRNNKNYYVFPMNRIRRSPEIPVFFPFKIVLKEKKENKEDTVYLLHLVPVPDHVLGEWQLSQDNVAHI
jgi:hypothetical protein